MNVVDPDQVENDAGAMWRGLYKLEKQFTESPNPLQMAKKVTQHKTLKIAHIHVYLFHCYTDQGSC